MTPAANTVAGDRASHSNNNTTMTSGGRSQSSWLRSALLVASLLAGVSGTGVQSDGSTSTFAGGMIYDANNNRIYVTGTTYDSSFGGFDSGSTGQSSTTSFCFVAAIDMDDWSFNDASVLDSSSTSTVATCQALGFLAPSTLVVGGNSEADTNGEVMSGFAWLLDRDNLATAIDTERLTPTQTGRVEYPQFIVTKAQSIYSISLASTDTNDNTNSIIGSTGTPFPNYMTQLKYGSSFDMTVRKLSVEQEEFLGVPTGSLNLVQEWIQEFPITTGSNDAPPRVYVGGVLIKGENTLIVAGSTRGMGRGYGNAEGSDEDGFLTLLNLQDGDLSSSAGMSNMRIGTAQDDVVMGICDDPLDSNSFYIVGATQGVIERSTNDDGDLSTPPTSLSAFVAKMNLNTLTIQWSRQFGARMSSDDASTPTSVFAAGCSVRGKTLYVAGGVEAGAGLIQGLNILESQGSDDIWVANMYTGDGSIDEWVQQVGTSEKDSLARHGGVQADANGSVILYGDTYGSFYRDRDSFETADVFVMELDQDSGAYAPIGRPVAAPTDSPVAPTPATSTPTEWYPNEVSDSRTTLTMISFALAAIGVLAVGCCCIAMGRRRERKYMDAQKTSLFAYLQQFDVEDIDLRKSPPGGWHGTYLHKLAYGINKAEVNDSRLADTDNHSKYETAPLTHSSVVRDSLFMDNAAAASLGQDENYESGGGLDDAYDDLEPRSYEDRQSSLWGRVV